jgi:hypothetical protein
VSSERHQRRSRQRVRASCKGQWPALIEVRSARRKQRRSPIASCNKTRLLSSCQRGDRAGDERPLAARVYHVMSTNRIRRNTTCPSFKRLLCVRILGCSSARLLAISSSDCRHTPRPAGTQSHCNRSDFPAGTSGRRVAQLHLLQLEPRPGAAMVTSKRSSSSRGPRTALANAEPDDESGRNVRPGRSPRAAIPTRREWSWRRPIDPAKFNGAFWSSGYNVTNGFDAENAWVLQLGEHHAIRLCLGRRFRAAGRG